MSSISIGGLSLDLSGEVFNQIIMSIFPGNDIVSILTPLFLLFVIGIVTLNLFLYFRNKESLLKDMPVIVQASLSIWYGCLSFFIVLLVFVILTVFNLYNFNNNNRMLIPMIFAGFILYTLLFISYKKYGSKNKKFLNLNKILIGTLVVVGMLAGIAVSIKIKDYKSLVFIIIGILLFFIYEKIMNKYFNNSGK